jgi:hypothetical protein
VKFTKTKKRREKMKTLIKTWSFWFIVVSEAFNFTLLVFADNLCAAIWSALAAYWACNSLYLEIKRSYLECDNLKLACRLFLATEMLKKYKKEKQEEK